MKKYILPLILIIIGGFAWWYGATQTGRGINPIGAIIKYGGMVLLATGIIVGIVKTNK